jgi:hypothetical protein
MDALISFGAALSARTFEAAAKAHNMDDEGTAMVKAKPVRATCVTNMYRNPKSCVAIDGYYDLFGLSRDD